MRAGIISCFLASGCSGQPVPTSSLQHVAPVTEQDASDLTLEELAFYLPQPGLYRYRTDDDLELLDVVEIKVDGGRTRNCRAVEKVCFFANADAKVPGIYIQNGKQEDLYLKAPLRTGDTWTDAGGTRATLVEFRAVSLQGQKHNKCLVIEVNFGEGYEELDAIQEVLCPELGVVQVFRHEGKSWVEDKQLTEHVRR